MIIDLLQVDEAQHVENADICVIGAGTAGLPLSQQLTRRSLKVVVLECGGMEGDARLLERGEAPVGWVKAIGGSSRIWGGRLIGLEPEELLARPRIGFPGWPISFGEMSSQTSAVEALFDIPPNTFSNSADWTYEDSAPPFGNRGPVVAKFPVIVGRGQRDVSRLLRTSDAQPVIYANAQVCDFSVDAAAARLTSVTAKTVKGNAVTVMATHFVIAGGAVESTRLLLWLNRRENGRIFSPAQNLGRYLQDHINYPSGVVGRYRPKLLSALLGLRSRDGARRAVHFALSPAMQHARSLPNGYLNFQISPHDRGQVERIRNAAIVSGQSGFGRAAVALAKSPKDIAFATMLAGWYLSKTSGYRPPGVEVVAQIGVEQLPSRTNGVALSKKLDRHGVAEAEVVWEPSIADDRNARKIQAIFATFWDQSGLTQSCPVRWRPTTQSGNGNAASLFHPCGCIGMGTDRATSIVGPDLGCHDIANLSVLSTAIMPSAGSGNPTMPLLQLTYRLANALAKAYLPASSPIRAPA